MTRRIWRLPLYLVLLGCGTGAGSDTPGDTDAPALDVPTDVATADIQPDTSPDVMERLQRPHAFARGPYAVGVREETFTDESTSRSLATLIWYPALDGGEPKHTYLLLPGGALTLPQPAAGAFPVVGFSHGFNGANFQSFTIIEHLVSHGVVVVAPNHTGNTLFDSGASDETVAAVALDRPQDVRFAVAASIALSHTPGDLLHEHIDATRSAVIGHSFGGWTALVLGGAPLDPPAAKATCTAGTPADIMCDYIPFWPDTLAPETSAALPGLMAVIVLAPGGVASFGPGPWPSGADEPPTLVFGGTLDTTTPMEHEITPIFERLASRGTLVTLEAASHMGFTNICDIEGAEDWLAEFCSVDGGLSSSRVHEITAGLATAWLGVHLLGDDRYQADLLPDAVSERFPEASLTTSD